MDPMNKDRDPNGGLSPNLKEQLQAFNRDFIDLVIFERGNVAGARAASISFLPDAVAAGLATLSSGALDGIALCRYTLFSCSFHATETWRRLARDAGEPRAVDERYSMSKHAVELTNTPRCSFLAVALAFAWHLHHMDRRLARVILGLHDETAALFAVIPLWRLHQVAYERPDLLKARWPENVGFWPDFIRIARDGTPAQLESARLVGAQLIAQELEPTSIQRLSPRASRRK